MSKLIKVNDIPNMLYVHLLKNNFSLSLFSTMNRLISHKIKCKNVNFSIT